MKRFYLTSFLVSALIPCIWAQVWAPIGAKWTYGTISTTTGTISYTEWISASDTVLNNFSYYRIERQGHAIDGDYSDHFFTREDDNIIWVYNDSSGTFSKLFDFSKTNGDWWTTEFGGCYFEMKVLDTRLDTLQGISSKSMKIEYRGLDTTKTPGIMWANRLVGGMERPLPQFDYHCNNVVPDNEAYTGIRCYQDTAVGLWKMDTTLSCDYATVGIEDISYGDEPVIYPNPFRDEFVLILSGHSEHQVTVSDVTGHVIRQVEIKGPINRIVVEGPSGLYFIQVRNLGSNEGFKDRIFKMIKL
ncbi:MAG TPA: hypothetical protein DCX54_13030 [Flavobacteriales bacterium]|nr:hypothetical protein [Flavobacteriales bacterium]